jgi:hypothetical protein
MTNTARLTGYSAEFVFFVQVGCTPSCTEVPRATKDKELQQRMMSYSPGNEATPPSGADVKWRFFWRLGWGESGENDEWGAQVKPQHIPEWPEAMDSWGHALLNTVEAVSRLLAIGYGLEEETFTSLLHGGHHLLAPTGGLLHCRHPFQPTWFWLG